MAQSARTPDALFESLRTKLADGLVPSQIFNDRTIYDLERRRIFLRAWQYIGHESEIPNSGDYVLRYIGEDPFIFLRDEDGKVRLLFDACRHRGTQLCRADKGNTSHFRCPYHGWTYKNTGELVGMPSARDSAQGLDRAEWSLIPAPQLDDLRGFYFACLDAEAPGLDEYLGDMRYYLDLLFEVFDFEVMAEPHRWTIEANWKLGVENFGGDDYHAVFLHRSAFEVGAIAASPSEFVDGHHIVAGNGHGVSLTLSQDPDADTYLGYPRELVSPNIANVDPSQADLVRRADSIVGTVFPNMSFIALPLTASPKSFGATPWTGVRVWLPRGPGRFEVCSWTLAPKGASDEFRESSYRAAMGTFSPSGLFEQDDPEPWESITRTAGSAFAASKDFPFNYQMGHNVGTATEVADFPGPGLVTSHKYEENVQRALYSRWLQYMASEEHPPSSSDLEGIAWMSNGR